jgi:hypothetical protein
LQIFRDEASYKGEGHRKPFPSTSLFAVIPAFYS